MNWRCGLTIYSWTLLPRNIFKLNSWPYPIQRYLEPTTCSILIPAHKTACSATCMHDHHFCLRWALLQYIPSLLADFAAWCYPHYIPIIPLAYVSQNEGVGCVNPRNPPVYSTHDATPLPAWMLGLNYSCILYFHPSWTSWSHSEPDSWCLLVPPERHHEPQFTDLFTSVLELGILRTLRTSRDW